MVRCKMQQKIKFCQYFGEIIVTNFNWPYFMKNHDPYFSTLASLDLLLNLLLTLSTPFMDSLLKYFLSSQDHVSNEFMASLIITIILSYYLPRHFCFVKSAKKSN